MVNGTTPGTGAGQTTSAATLARRKAKGVAGATETATGGRARTRGGRILSEAEFAAQQIDTTTPTPEPTKAPTRKPRTVIPGIFRDPFVQIGAGVPVSQALADRGRLKKVKKDKPDIPRSSRTSIEIIPSVAAEEPPKDIRELFRPTGSTEAEVQAQQSLVPRFAPEEIARQQSISKEELKRSRAFIELEREIAFQPRTTRERTVSVGKDFFKVSTLGLFGEPTVTRIAQLKRQAGIEPTTREKIGEVAVPLSGALIPGFGITKGLKALGTTGKVIGVVGLGVSAPGIVSGIRDPITRRTEIGRLTGLGIGGGLAAGKGLFTTSKTGKTSIKSTDAFAAAEEQIRTPEGKSLFKVAGVSEFEVTTKRLFKKPTTQKLSTILRGKAGALSKEGEPTFTGGVVETFIQRPTKPSRTKLPKVLRETKIEKKTTLGFKEPRTLEEAKIQREAIKSGQIESPFVKSQQAKEFFPEFKKKPTPKIEKTPTTIEKIIPGSPILFGKGKVSTIFGQTKQFGIKTLGVSVEKTGKSFLGVTTTAKDVFKAPGKTVQFILGRTRKAPGKEFKPSRTISVITELGETSQGRTTFGSQVTKQVTRIKPAERARLGLEITKAQETALKADITTQQAATRVATAQTRQAARAGLTVVKVPTTQRPSDFLTPSRFAGTGQFERQQFQAGAPGIAPSGLITQPTFTPTKKVFVPQALKLKTSTRDVTIFDPTTSTSRILGTQEITKLKPKQALLPKEDLIFEESLKLKQKQEFPLPTFAPRFAPPRIPTFIRPRIPRIPGLGLPGAAGRISFRRRAKRLKGPSQVFKPSLASVLLGIKATPEESKILRRRRFAPTEIRPLLTGPAQDPISARVLGTTSKSQRGF